MPYVDFTTVEDNDNYEPIPDGEYSCTVDHAEEKKTKNGDPMIVLYLKVDTGKYEGRIVFDRITFSETGMKRVKFVASRLGISKDYKGQISPELLKGRRALVTVGRREFEGKVQNSIPWGGYANLTQEVPKDLDAGDDIPF